MSEFWFKRLKRASWAREVNNGPIQSFSHASCSDSIPSSHLRKPLGGQCVHSALTASVSQVPTLSGQLWLSYCFTVSPVLSLQTQKTWVTLRMKDSLPCIIAEEPSNRPKSTTWSATSSQPPFSLSPHFALSAMNLSGTVTSCFPPKLQELSFVTAVPWVPHSEGVWGSLRESEGGVWGSVRECEGLSTVGWWSVGWSALKTSKKPDSTQDFLIMWLWKRETHSRKSLLLVSFPWLWQNTHDYQSYRRKGLSGLTVPKKVAYLIYFRPMTRQDAEAGQSCLRHLKASRKQERREKTRVPAFLPRAHSSDLTSFYQIPPPYSSNITTG